MLPAVRPSGYGGPARTKILLTALVWHLHLDPDEMKHRPAVLAELLWKVADGKTPDDLIKKPGDLRVRDASQPEYTKQLFQIWEYAPGPHQIHNAKDC